MSPNDAGAFELYNNTDMFAARDDQEIHVLLESFQANAENDFSITNKDLKEAARWVKEFPSVYTERLRSSISSPSKSDSGRFGTRTGEATLTENTNETIKIPQKICDYLMETLFKIYSEEYYASGWFSGISTSVKIQESFTEFIRSGIAAPQPEYVTEELPAIRKCVEYAFADILKGDTE